MAALKVAAAAMLRLKALLSFLSRYEALRLGTMIMGLQQCTRECSAMAIAILTTPSKMLCMEPCTVSVSCYSGQACASA